MRKTIRRLCATAAISISLTIAPSHAAIGPSCASQHTPARIWMGEALSQTFTPTSETIMGFDIKVFFRRSFDGVIGSSVQLNVPAEAASYELAPRGVELAKATARASGGANTSTWVRFTLAQPVPAVAAEDALLEIEVRPGRDPAWAWIQCASSYRGGRAYGRAAINAEGATVPNELVKFPLSPTADLQFRIRGG